MAIQPIELPNFSRNSAPIESILARGGSAFGSILRDLAQINKSQADNQARQESEFLTEQRREINLNERRNELAQQNYEDERRFNEDRRQFDVKFGEGVRQFDTGLIESSLDRGLRERGLDLQETNMQADNEIARGNLTETQERNDLSREDLVFRRNQATEEKAAKRELETVNLETAKIRLADAKDDTQRKLASDAYKAAQSAALVKMDALIQGEDQEAAKSYFRTNIEGYDFDAGTKSRLAAQLGISNGNTQSKEQETPVEALTAAQIDEELALLEGAVDTDGSDPTRSARVSEDRATRISQLRLRRDELKKGPKFMDSRRY